MDGLKHVLFISYDGMTDPLGQSQVLPYLRGLRKKGYYISLISCEKKDRFNMYQQQIQEYCTTSDIKWYPVDYSHKVPVISIIRNILKINNKAKKIYKKNKFHLLHCRSYISALIGLRMKSRYNARMLFDMRGFWADERVEGQLWDLTNPVFKQVYNYFKRKEKVFLSQSDHIISLTENGKTEILSWKIPSINDGKITIIPCCVDLELFDPNKIDNNEITEKQNYLGISGDDYILGYVGSIGTWYMLPEMLDYFIVLKRVRPNSKFLFVTGENPEYILKEAQNKNIGTSDIIITSCLHKEVPLHVSLFNKAIFFIRPSYSKKASSPTKQGEIMAMGIPLVCNAGVGDTDVIVTEYEAGTVIQNLDNSSYEKVVKKEIPYNRDKTIEGAKNYFSLETGVEKYAEIYRELIGN